MNIIGHKITQDFFIRVIDRGVLSHAYVLVGSEHVGKETVVTGVAAKILNTPAEKVYQHPDVRFIRRQYDEKNNRLKRDIAVSEMRDLLRFASQSSFQPNGYKIIVIVEAERLNIEAANAILKILEEPPERTIFFLLYQNEAAVLPTIHSRAQNISISPVPIQELVSGLINRGFAEEDAQIVASLSHGLPGQAINWLTDPDSLTVFKTTSETLKQLMGVSITDKFKAVEPWFKAAKDEGGVDFVVERLEHWRQILAAWLASGTAPITHQQIAAVLDRLDETIIALRKNAHPPLAVQSFLLSLP